MNHPLPGDFWLTFLLQNMGEWIAPVMTFFTWIGYPQAYMMIVAIIYWSFDRKVGLRLAIFLPVVSSVNSMLKQAIHAPRPYWLDPRIEALHVSNGFGMPSGHAQASVSWIYAGAILKKGWFWIPAIVIPLMVGISRVYLGVHFSSQVIAGWLIGLIVVYFFIRFESKFLSWLHGIQFKYRLIFVFGVSMFVLLLGGFFVYLLQEWEMPAQWMMNSMDDLAGRDETILLSIGIQGVAGNAGGFMGVTLGALILQRMGGFEMNRLWWKRLLASVTGLVVFLALYGIFMAISPDQGQSALYAVWRFSSFFVISFSAIFLVPILLIRINLLKPAVRRPDEAPPEI
jgi:membrane-associated phospholipid phosphatase